jgi:hypothetical protein
MIFPLFQMLAIAPIPCCSQLEEEIKKVMPI